MVPKGPSSLPKRDPFDDSENENENEKTAIESGWEDEASTTVAEQGDVAEKIRAIGAERADRTPPKTGVTSTSMLDEPTVDDRRANVALSIGTPQAVTGARLLITGGNDKGNVLAIQHGKTYTIGRAIDNDMVLTDIAVSRKHFDLKSDGGAWVLVDRRSGNGTVVNGNIEDNAFMLASGDVIEIGNTTFRFEMPNGLPRSHPASAMETPATSSMDASMLDSLDAPLAKARGPVNRRPPDDEDDDDEDDEQSTVAGKALQDEPPPAPQPPPPRARPATLGPPPPPAPPPARVRPATNAPPLPMPMQANPAPMPYGMPAAATSLPMPHQQGRPLTQQPTMLGDAMGMPVQPQPQPGGAPAPMLYNNGYPTPQAPQQPMGMHPSMPQYSDYGGMQMMPPYAQQQHQQRPAGISRRTKMIIGAAGLAVAAAILTVVIIKVATGNDEPAAKKTESKQPVATAKPDKLPKTDKPTTAAPSKPTVEPIKQNTATPVPPTTTAPSKPTVEPIKQTTTTEPVKTEPVKVADKKPAVEPVKVADKKPAVEPVKVDPAKKERDEAAAAKRREEATAKKERDAEARREREEAAARKREEAAAKKREQAEASSSSKPDKRVAADTSGVKDKADDLYRNKNFTGAAAALKAAAKGVGAEDASDLKSLAGVYENFGKAYNVGMAPGTPPKQAFDLLVKAKNFDNRAGNAFTSEINGKLAEIAPKAAVAFMADKDYVRAKNAVAIAESGGKGNSSTQGVKSSLESAAGKLFKEAQAEMGSDEKAARDKLKQVQQMVDSKSQWHQKAGKLLSGG